MKKTAGLFLVLLAIATTLFTTQSCKKELFGNGQLTFSTDTLTFDTVFTTLGSTTKYFKVFNRSSKAVRIDDIRLMHLTGDQFRINVDGIPGDQFSGIEIPAKDSIYVFVEVTVNPNSTLTPFVIIDDVNFTMGSNTNTVHLQAFGQNAHFHYGSYITSDEHWTNDKPHVVINNDSIPGALVACGATLTIDPGTKVFFTNNSGIFVEGNLIAEATNWSDSIVFQGVRLEQYYDDKPGQWFGIVFLRDSTSSSCKPTGSFNHCVLTESSYGIYAGAGISTDLNKYLGAASRPDIHVNNCIIKHSLYNAIYGFNAEIAAENSLFFVAGDNLLKFGLGGEYTFNSCTIYNQGSKYVSHEKESVLLSNFVAVNNTTSFKEPLTSTFINCVVYGSLDNEISFNNINDGAPQQEFTNTFVYSLLKTPSDTLAIFSVGNNNNIFNDDPKFKDPYAFNFTPSDSAGYFSPLIDAAPTGLSQDVFDHTRGVIKVSPANGTPYDLGAIEVQ